AVGDAQRAMTEEPAAEPGQPAMVGRAVPIERGRVLDGAAMPPEPDREASEHRVVASAPVAPAAREPEPLRLAIARSLRVDGSQLGPQRRDERPIRRAQARPPRLPVMPFVPLPS